MGPKLFRRLLLAFLLADRPESRQLSASKLQNSRLEKASDIEALDRLISLHLLEGRKDKFLLLDPHAEEVAVLRNTKHDMVERSRERLYSADFGAFEGLTPTALSRIENGY